MLHNECYFLFLVYCLHHIVVIWTERCLFSVVFFIWIGCWYAKSGNFKGKFIGVARCKQTETWMVLLSKTNDRYSHGCYFDGCVWRVHKLRTGCFYNWPQLATTIFLLVFPLWEPQDSIFLITSMPSTTVPKTTWRLSNQEVLTVVIKNWEPFVFGPALACKQ